MAVIKVTIVNFLMEQCVGAVQAETDSVMKILNATEAIRQI